MQNLTVITMSVISLLLVIAGTTKLISKYTKVPFTILLMIVGFLLSYLTQQHASLIQQLTQYQGYPDILLYVCLPTLIFQAAFTMDGRLLRQNIMPVLALSIPGLCISTLLIGLIVNFLTPLSLSTGLLLGAILSATDSVAVIAIFRQLSVPKRLSILVEGESLFNSSTAFVVVKTILFVMAATVITTHGLIFAGIYQFVWNFFGGILVGLFTTFLTGYLISFMEDEILIVVSLTVILAYFSFILAEIVFQVSGVMATITAGVVMADWGRTKFSSMSEKYISVFLGFLAYIVNSLIFILVGYSIKPLVLLHSIGMIVIVIIAMLVARAVMVFGLIPLISQLPNSAPINLRYQTITWLGGIQGALGLTMVLGISQSVPEHDLLISIVMAAVLFTIIVQGSLMGKMIHWLKLDRPLLSDRTVTIEAELAAEYMTLERIPALQNGGSFSMKIAKNLEAACKKSIVKKKKQLDRLKEKKLTDEKEKRLLLLSCLAEEKCLYYDIFSKGHLSEKSYRFLTHNIDMEIDSIRYRGKIIRKNTISWFGKIYLFCMELGQKIPLLAGIENKLRIRQSITDYDEKWGAHQGCIAVLKHLDEVTQTNTIDKKIINQVKKIFVNWFNVTEKYLNEVADQFPEFVNDMQERFGKRLLLHAKYESMINQVQQGVLPQTVADRIIKKYKNALQKLTKKHPEKLKLDPLNLLRQIPIFKDFSETELEEVIKLLHEHHASPGEMIIREGDAGDSLYLIARGVVRVLKDQAGRDVEVATLMAGDFFGEIALLQHVKRTATCKTVTPCILYILTRGDFEVLIQRFPGIKAIVAKRR